jgi:hypothetical protein
MDFELNKELAKKIAINIGATPISFEKVGLTHKDLLTKIKLKISNDDDEIQYIKVWYGEAAGSENLICCLLTLLSNNDDSFEIVFVIGFKKMDNTISEELFIGYKYDFLDVEDQGSIFIKFKSKDKWLLVGLLERLKSTLAFETLVQEGVIWQSSREVPTILLDNLSEMIEVDGFEKK